MAIRLSVPALVAMLLLLACASKPAIEQPLTDYELVSLVQQAFSREPNLANTHITVTAVNGTIELSGWVKTDDQRQLAGDVAQSVEGVLKVINTLRLFF